MSPVDTMAERANHLQQVLQPVAGDPPEVKRAVVEAVVPPPRATASDIIWVILVIGLVGLLVLAILGLTHLIGSHVSDDKVITVFSSALAGLLGLFVKSPVT